MRIKRLMAGILVLAMSCTMFACNKESNSESTTKATQNSENSQTSEDTTTKTGTKSIVWGVQQDIDNFDPHKMTSAGTKEIFFNVYEGLVKADKDGNMAYAVASDLKISDDGLKYTFTLRDGVKFHNGNLVTAKDVKYSLDRCAGLLPSGEKALVSALKKISKVDIIDDKTVEVTLSAPDFEMIYYLNAAIIPYEADVTGEFSGTGPFMTGEYRPGESLVLNKNKDYYVAGYPKLDSVTVKIVKDGSAALVYLKSGAIDFYPYLTADQEEELSDDFDIVCSTTDDVQALFLNNAVTPLNNLKVRQAICYAIDKNEINAFVNNNKGQIIGSSMLPGLKDYYNDLTSMYKTDVAKAKELLKEAGYPNGFELEITYPTNYQIHVDTAVLIQQQLEKAGIKVTLKGVDWNTWVSDVYTGRNYQATVCAVTSQLAPGYLLARYTADNSKNFVNFSNEAYDSIFNEANTTNDKAVKVKDYKELQKILAEDAASVYIEVCPVVVAKKKNLTGYTTYPVYVQDLSTIDIK